MIGSNVVTNLMGKSCVGGPQQRIALVGDESNVGTEHGTLPTIERSELVSVTDSVNIGNTYVRPLAILNCNVRS